MEETVYADIYFLINFSMDFLCLFLTARLMSEKPRLGRISAASVFGGVYAVAALLILPSGVWAVAFDIFACVVISLIAFLKRGRLRSTLGLAVVYTAVSIGLGGIMTALFTLFNRLGLSQMLSGGEVSEDSPTVWVLLILAVAGAVMTGLCGRFFRSRSSKRFATLEITFEGRSAALRGMVDSGNLLREPVSGRPCIVADCKRVSSVFPYELIRIAEKGEYSRLKDVSPKYAKRIRLIPASTALGEGMLMGVRADRIELGDGKGKKEVDAFVVISRLGDRAEGCGALIPQELLI